MSNSFQQDNLNQGDESSRNIQICWEAAVEMCLKIILFSQWVTEHEIEVKKKFVPWPLDEVSEVLVTGVGSFLLEGNPTNQTAIMDFSPPFRTPVMDLTGSLINFQQSKRCADFEMNFVECMEAYGVPKAYTKCSEKFEDFRECATRAKQFYRANLIREERARQYKAGLISKPHSDPPRDDSY